MNVQWLVQQLKWPPPVPHTLSDMSKLESYHDVFDLYLWLRYVHAVTCRSQSPNGTTSFSDWCKIFHPCISLYTFHLRIHHLWFNFEGHLLTDFILQPSIYRPFYWSWWSKANAKCPWYHHHGRVGSTFPANCKWRGRRRRGIQQLSTKTTNPIKKQRCEFCAILDVYCL